MDGDEDPTPITQPENLAADLIKDEATIYVNKTKQYGDTGS